jgi:hypothetical protein
MSSLPVFSSQPTNSSILTSLDSVECQARSRRVGRSSLGPIASSQRSRRRSCRLGSGSSTPPARGPARDVGAETIVVGERMAGLVDPVVNTATEVLDEAGDSRSRRRSEGQRSAEFEAWFAIDSKGRGERPI